MRLSVPRHKLISTCLITAVIIAIGGGCSSQPASRTQDPQEDSVRAVVGAYLHGLKFNDVPSLRSAFWPDAKLLFVKPDGSLGQLSQEEWYRMFAGSAGKEEAGDLGIASIDITDNAASVKVIETYPKSIYVDYLNLLRLNGKWIVVNKIYTSRPR
jgi:Putative lumazine-binding